MRLNHLSLNIPTNNPGTLKKDLNDFKWQLMSDKWPGKFTMHEDHEHRRLIIKFKEILKASFDFNGLEFPEELSAQNIIIKALSHKSVQSRFKISHLDKDNLLVLMQLDSNFFIEVDKAEEMMTFTPRLDTVLERHKKLLDEDEMQTIKEDQEDEYRGRERGTSDGTEPEESEDLFGFGK